jgi:hypothetical protein
MNKKDLVILEVKQNLQDARDSAMLGNYDTAQVYYEGVIHEMNGQLANQQQQDIVAKKADLLKCRKLIEVECELIKEIAKSLVVFKSSSQPVLNNKPTILNNAYNNGGFDNADFNSNNYNHLNYQNNYEIPERDRDPDVWPPPPPSNSNNNNSKHKSNFGSGYNNVFGNSNGGSNQSPKHKDYPKKTGSNNGGFKNGTNSSTMKKSINDRRNGAHPPGNFFQYLPNCLVIVVTKLT